MPSVLSQSFVWPVRVYYEDTDAGGRVYYVNYLKFMERARTEWLRDLGWEQSVLPVLFVVRQAQIDYVAPALLDDALKVDVQLTHQQGARLHFVQQIWRDEVCLCRAEIQVACIDAQTHQPCRLPAELRAALQPKSA
ncbi:tol-pal system-associated acyl-CoA thioesterase [Marinospirillum sp. MEB164]|uniref:Tol-pal system-associated acyl-CoA thioesterase n=1 Tax=Marinospirillum alkalitolerans TaxID=3123374 RepID=A0ABW8PYT2_9GAMM